MPRLPSNPNASLERVSGAGWQDGHCLDDTVNRLHALKGPTVLVNVHRTWLIMATGRAGKMQSAPTTTAKAAIHNAAIQVCGERRQGRPRHVHGPGPHSG
jgi:hypothetical protein